MNIKKLHILFLFLCLSVIVFGQDDFNKNFVRQNATAGGLNFKFMPALYWDCLGIEAEYPISDIMSIGINGLFQAGRTDAGNLVFKVRPETYQNPAYRIELAAKYYLSSHAPIGTYLQFNVSYSSLLFFDGTNRPFTMHSRWKKFNSGNIREPVELDRPIEISTGVGVGYQLIIIPKKILGNIMVGAQGYFTKDSGVYPGVYLSPSIGLML